MKSLLFSVRVRLYAIMLGMIALPLLLTSCGGEGAAAEETQTSGKIAVSTSWLECCLRDLAGAELDLLRVCPPGTCPGHFDIRPGAAAELHSCRMLFLFDFQQSLGEKLQTFAPDEFDAVPVAIPGGLCVPSSYLQGCEAVQAALSKAYPENEAAYKTALDGVRERIARLEDEVQQQIQTAGLKGAKVMASGHQEKFCRWLGLEPVAMYSGPDTASPAQIEALLQKGKASGVQFVIANQQEGAQAGEALAHQLNAPLVVFSNFPSMSGGETTFDALVRANVANLLKAVESRNERKEQNDRADAP
ncbi:zinc ABC transporter substrate-binding protein [Candidatus Sumerlaeota bacterium]|nr:zinc ABC transporter substrate-binding protein [Candidatus Sumerlaeota bacterium]